MTAETFPSGITIYPIPAFTDNYIWCIHDDTNAIVVDPGDAEPVLAFINAKGLTLSAVLITHHHRDHTGGIAKLATAVPELPIIGPRGNHIRGITKSVAQGDNTKVYCTHEYTQANVNFALAVEPDNGALNHYADWVASMREQNLPTLPSNLEEQKNINPFLRAHELSVKTAAEAYCENNLADDVAVFAAVRRWKDEF